MKSGERWDSPTRRATAGCCCGETCEVCDVDAGLWPETKLEKMCALTFIGCARHVAVYGACDVQSRLLSALRVVLTECWGRCASHASRPTPITADHPPATAKGHQSSFTRETQDPLNCPYTNMSSPLVDVWEAAASSPFSPAIGKNTQFTVGFVLLAMCMLEALLCYLVVELY